MVRPGNGGEGLEMVRPGNGGEGLEMVVKAWKWW